VPSTLLSNLVRWLGFAAVVIPAFARAMSVPDPFPYWDMDPLQIATPLTGLTPTGSLILDAITLAGAALALAGEALAGRRVSLPMTLLAAVGVVGVAFHARANGGSVDDLLTGSAWVAAIISGLALFHLCRDPRFKRLALALALGFVGMLAVKGLEQILIDHPQTVREFRANNSAFLAARGWSADSDMARSFERRLLQAEATGWFGLANIVASYAAASTVAFAGLLALAVAGRRASAAGCAGDEPTGPSLLAVVLGLVVSIATLIMAGAKGGYAAAALGLATLALAWLVHRPPSALRPFIAGRRSLPALGGLVAIAAVAAAIAAVFLRGLVGERLHELSLLFRWFYDTAALRMFAAHPLVGVGPAGFKDAYLLAKPSISPEEVTSSHSIVFDYLATLGLCGVAWLALWFAWIWGAGRQLFTAPASGSNLPSSTTSAPEESRLDAWALVGFAAVPAVFSSWIERSIATTEAGLGRIIGLGVWAAIGLGALAIMRRAALWPAATAAAVVALAAHAQIEVSPVWPSSAPLFMLIIAAVGSSAPRRNAPIRATGQHWSAWLPAAAATVTCAILCVLAIPAVARWQSALSRAAHLVEPVADFRTRLSSLAAPATGDAGAESPSQLAADLARAVGHPVATTPQAVNTALAEFTALLAPQATEALLAAGATFPTHAKTAEAASRLCLQTAQAQAELGHAALAAALARQAWDIAERASRSCPARSSPLAWLATVGSSWYDLDHDAAHVAGASAALERALPMDPYGLGIPRRLLATYRTLGDGPQIRRAARLVLEADQRLYLDTLRQLTAAQRQEAQRLAEQP
jgi:hypothetical protein